MKSLDLSQMEIINGGELECSSLLGYGVGLALAGLFIGVTAGAGAVVIGAALSSGVFTVASDVCTI